MSLREKLTIELATKHPEACTIVQSLIQAIDLELRQSSDCDPEVHCLSTLEEHASAAIENLAMNDVTPVESDHAFRVMAGLFEDLGRTGVQFVSAEEESDITAGAK